MPNPTMSGLRLAAALLAAVSLVAQEGEPLPLQKGNPKTNPDEALARYKTTQQRLPFRFHTQGRETLARSRTTDALRVLADDYAKAKNYGEYTRYSLAALFACYFDKPEFTAQFAALRSANNKPVDTWMWAKTLTIEADHGDEKVVQAIALEEKAVHLRAAAIVALGESRDGNIKNAIVSNCVSFPKKEAERNLLLGAMSGALFENKQRVNTAEYREALRAYIGLLAEDVDLTHTAKIQMARHLQWILKGPALFVNPEPWLELLERGDVKLKQDNRTTAGSRFFGIETEGERFCYVLDMSDSMCKEISPSVKPQGPLTGPKQKKPKGALPDESDLPWNKIQNRWDLAREQLRISLQRLPSDKYFSVVWFGTDAGTIEATKGMVKATKANINRAMAELDAIEVGKPDPVKAPDGQLRGKTNMHQGLRVAYSLTNKGYVESGAYVDGAVLNEGCDTIFLLSDGAPSWDGFDIVDKDYGEGRVVVDTEYNAGAQRTPNLHYHGPYDQVPWLLEDVARMNSFRRIRMHCIGLGEANMRLLEQLAEMGHGDVFQFGAKTGAANGTK